MFPKYGHAPIVDQSRIRCPVCNHAVYSLAGVHPQCAIRLLDPPHSAPHSAKKKPPPSSPQPLPD
jgi:hypothetical protein